MKIHHRLTIIFSFVFAFILIGVYSNINPKIQQYAYDSLLTDLKQKIALSRSFVSNFSKNKQSLEVWDHLADQIGSDLNLRATIIDRQGVVLGDSRLTPAEIRQVENHLARPEILQSLEEETGLSRRFSTTIKKNMLYISSHIQREHFDGFIRLAVPLASLESIKERLQRLLLVSLLGAFILACVLGYIAAAYFAKPLNEITRAAHKISEGQYDERIYVHSKDTVGQLAQSINHMADQVRMRIDEVAKERSRLEAVFLSMIEGVLVLDSKGNIVLMNKSLRELFNIAEDIAGKNPLEVIRNIKVQEVINETMHLHEGVYSSEISVFFPEEKTFLIHATPVMRSQERQGVVLIFLEITELRRLETIRQEFVANVSHELRTPLSSIKGYAETLLDGALKDKQNARDFINIIHSDADRLARLIDDILDLSKIETGKLQLNYQPTSLQLLVQSVLIQLQQSIEERTLRVHSQVSPSLPKVLCDPDKIIQVLFNLIDNAIKYTPKDGVITIVAQEKGDKIQVDVVDTGVGIAEEHLPRLFERFYRVDKARSRELGGTGLGLSIVKHIIHSHQGEVFVKSIPSQGSTFSFTLPKA